MAYVKGIMTDREYEEIIQRFVKAHLIQVKNFAEFVRKGNKIHANRSFNSRVLN